MTDTSSPSTTGAAATLADAPALLARVERSDLAFPHMRVQLPGAAIDAIETRVIGTQVVTRLQSQDGVAVASRKQAEQSGLGRHFKLQWQLAGTTRYDDADRSILLKAGEMLISPVGRDYRIETSAAFDSLVLIFDPTTTRSWQDIVQCEMARPLGPSGAIAATAGGVAALLQHAGSAASDHRVTAALIDLALSSLNAPEDGPASPTTPATLARARLVVAANLADGGYGPDRLARDLGLSRRSLYNRFDGIGLSPSQFIKRHRLDQARREILSDRVSSLTTIALRNGFADSSRFSHAFKAAYGMSPRALRQTATKR